LVASLSGTSTRYRVAVGPRELGQHEAVKAVALTARGAEARAHRGDLVRVHGDHRQARVEQPLDQQPIRPLHRDQFHAIVHQPPAQRADPPLVMPVASTLHDPAVLVEHAARVLLAGPIHASKTTYYSRLLPSINDLDCCRRRGTLAVAH
jgi:hypothetical protein